jgi:hypothetical protein
VCYFHDSRLHTYIINGVIGWHTEIYSHFVGIASECDGNFLQSEDLHCKETYSSTSFLHIILCWN